MLSLSAVSIPGVLVLISFLSYSSQILFLFIQPYKVGQRDQIIFNLLVVTLLICYFRSCATDAGSVPLGWNSPTDDSNVKNKADKTRQRFCAKCAQVKPPRAHHCKVCKRCIVKMDHHCPWTRNCVSHRTMPHFLRFLFYADASMAYLQYFLWIRVKILWENRHFPSYLGPSVPALIHLFLLIIVNSITLFALAILFLRTIWTVALNTTTIEGWEIERHEAVCRRARVLGGYLTGPNGEKVMIKRQEFPYDVGVWQNCKQAMGSGNVLTWIWPFAQTPSLENGFEFPVNGFEDPSLTWPPPDPDRIPRIRRKFEPTDAFTYSEEHLSPQDEIEAFRRRQTLDIQRKGMLEARIHRRQPFHKRTFHEHNDSVSYDLEDDQNLSDEGEEAWRNSEGDRLDDFGVEEDVEFYDEDDVPLARLIGSQRAKES